MGLPWPKNAAGIRWLLISRAGPLVLALLMGESYPTSHGRVLSGRTASRQPFEWGPASVGSSSARAHLGVKAGAAGAAHLRFGRHLYRPVPGITGSVIGALEHL